MKKLRKPLLLFLSFTTLLLSPASQLIASCDSQSLAQNMPCSSKAVNKCEQAKVELTAPSCCCKFSESSSPVIPTTIISVKVIEGAFKKNEQRILKDNAFLESDLNGKESNHSGYGFFFQPKFLSSLKIYSIISSYLI
ncbi:hypothetical protein IH824_09265 [candidate division KSB1 bacterium]|nr:hypothetical protein [candidate division KSB1 bacterium]